MALAGVLSAIRQLVLDGPPPGGDAVQRRADLAQRFPGLAPRELDDLAAIPPERIRVYTRLVFAGECSLLEWACPLSLAAMHALAREAGDRRSPRELGLELVHRMHAHRPWRSPSVRELVANFQAFVRERCADPLARWSGLADLVDFERTETEVFYAADTPLAPVSAAQLGQMTAMSVGELLECRVARPAYVALRRYGFDVAAFAEQYRGVRPLPSAPDPPSRPWLAACGRAAESGAPTWMTMNGPAEWAALSACGDDAPVSLNDVAAAFLNEMIAGAQAGASPIDEARAFEQFFALLARCFDAGVLLSAESGGR
ncbi:MAG: hypothetical protein LC135_06495 [Phycisphaerae bacterium]|jgi:hypothetical protein|nr:hypothetical protein [Phycisphaerae bacterium]MCZ2399506.1 hypothetical protein [Phycisphaerae bacterium]